MFKNKEVITNIILENLKHDTHYKNLNVEQVLLKWWMTGRSSPGLRLTDEGKKCFESAGIQHYDFYFENVRTPTTFIMSLNNKMKCPYYIGLNIKNNKKAPFIRIYDNKIAMLVTLYGEIQNYLDSLQ